MLTVITGGAGFIGQSLARTLLNSSLGEIVLADNLARHGETSSLRELTQSSRVRFLETDLTDPNAVRSLPPADRVYHLAGIVGVDNVVADPARVMWANTSMTAHVFQWFVESARPNARLLFASTSEVYSGAALVGLSLPVPTPEDVPAVIGDTANPRFSYALSKLWGEMYGRFVASSTGAFIAAVRYHNVYGPAMGTSHVIPQVVRRALNREAPFRIIGSEETRSFCWVDDAAEATWRLLESPMLEAGDLVHIGDSDGEIRIGKLYEMIFDVLDWRPAETVVHPSAPGSVPRRCPDTSFLQRLTGYTPSTDLNEGLRRTIAWYRENC